jgi:hypothetical protein
MLSTVDAKLGEMGEALQSQIAAAKPGLILPFDPTPVDYMLAVMLDPSASTARRDKMALSLAKLPKHQIEQAIERRFVAELDAAPPTPAEIEAALAAPLTKSEQAAVARQVKADLAQANRPTDASGPFYHPPRRRL